MSHIIARLNGAPLTVFKPLARTLLTQDFSCNACIELQEDTFVGAASADYGKRHRPASISRVAKMTG